MDQLDQEMELPQMTLQTFLLNEFGNQGKREEGEDDKSELEVMKAIGIERFVVAMLGIRISFQIRSICHK